METDERPAADPAIALEQCASHLAAAADAMVDTARRLLPQPPRPTLIARASTIVRLRQARLAHFEESLIRDVAWDILLDVYIVHAMGKPARLKHLRLTETAPRTTMVRWLARLEERRLLVRERGRGDKRLAFLRLTPEGTRRMEAYLSVVPMDIEGGGNER